jgi:hypothetical protein
MVPDHYSMRNGSVQRINTSRLDPISHQYPAPLFLNFYVTRRLEDFTSRRERQNAEELIKYALHPLLIFIKLHYRFHIVQCIV